MKELKILISHNAAEKELAEAWKALLETTSLGVMRVWFSSDPNPGGGVPAGREWRDDLYQRLQESDFILAIQTPASAGRPWIMWECGIARGIGKERGIIPILYSIERSKLANPLDVYQAYQGDDATQVRELCERLLVDEAQMMRPKDSHFNKPIRVYMSAVNLHRPRKGLREEQITLWSNRIENLVQSGRMNELNVMRQMMYASLGKPVDLAIHEKLGQLLLQQRYYAAALEETNYALTFSPDDIPLLHQKSLTLVELHDLNEAKKLVGRIVTLDKSLNVNPEIAALQGRIYREQWRLTQNPVDLNAAIDAYYRAYQENPMSYYTGVNAAELAFAKGDVTLGKKIAEEVLATCQQFQSQPIVSYWTDFSAGADRRGHCRLSTRPGPHSCTGATRTRIRT